VTRRSPSSEAGRLPAPAFVLSLTLLSLPGCVPTEEIPLPPDEIRACYEADGFRRLGDPATALARAEELVAGDPGLLPAHRVVQDAMVDLGRIEEARARYVEAAADRADDPAAAYLAGRAMIPDADAARDHFEQCRDRDPDFAWCTIGLARLEVLEGDLFGSVQLHREHLERDAQQADLHLSVGTLYLEMRLLRDAQRSFEAALALHPWDTTAMGGLGQTLGLMGRYQESTALLERALEIDSSRTDLLGSLAYVRYQDGDLEGAWEAITSQQEIDGSADPLLVWKLQRALEREMPFTVVLGPYHLQRPGEVEAP